MPASEPPERFPATREVVGFYFQRTDWQCDDLWRDFIRHLGGEARWIKDGEGFRRGLHVIVAVKQDEARVVGHISLVQRPIEIPTDPPTGVRFRGGILEEMFVQTFRVDEQYRRRGIGRRLQEEAFQLAADRRCYQLRSWCSLDKEANYRLKLGLRFAVHPAFEHHPELPDPDIPGVFFLRTTGILPDEPRLPNHRVVLEDDAVRLRPLTEDDWPALLRWNRDPEVLWWSDGDDVTERSEPETRNIIRGMAHQGHHFIIESPPGEPAGEMCVQRMNLPRRLIPGKNLLRLPISIGDQSKWDRGIGKRAVRLALRFAFEQLAADMVCAVDVSSANQRSVNLWRSLGFSVIAAYPNPESKHGPATLSLDFGIARSDWQPA